MNQPLIHWIDYVIVILSVVLAVGLGLYFARRQKSTDTYFAGGRNIPA